MSKPTGKLLFAYQTIADLEVERDQLRTANQRLEGEVARLTLAIANQTVRRFVGDDDQRQMDELVAAGIRVDQQEIKRLREALIEVTASLEWNAHGICRGVTEGPIMPSAMAVAFAKAALSTANGEVTE